ncbi:MULTISPECIES: endospore germination permease [Paenibacillus]|uniref:Endospore germination permease n=1 Tax=Paenibacillus violae TaxID=3077234 RepID=A0ABU3RPC8_9BACL|nr:MULTISPECIES: endospore germination permease [Paenibacillus]MDU0206013.1 endospore germination permease [Paenibacillus sp. PFR10]MEC0269539.1 endospore germination permease [Paenibacillus anseongense]
MKNGSITFLQTSMMLMLSIGLLNHVIIIPMLLQKAQRDSWISVLLAGAFFMIWVVLLYSVIGKNRDMPLFQWLKLKYGAMVSYLLAGFACIYIFTLSTITLKDTVTWIHLAFSTNTPIIVLASALLIVCSINAYKGIESIANTAAIFLPFVVILGFYVMTANHPNKEYSLLKPILEFGMKPVWHGVIYVEAGLLELSLLLFIKHHIRTRISFMSLVALTLILILLTFGPLVGAISEFGPKQASHLRFPAYEEWRLVTIGHFIEHMDFLSIYQWFSGAFLRISLTLFLINDILGIEKKRNKTLSLFLICSIQLIATCLPISDPKFINLITDILLPGIFWGMSGYFLIIIGLIHFGHRWRRVKS